MDGSNTQILAGAAYLHSLGMSHGDIKPQNYLLGFKENVLGIAPYYKFDAKISEAHKARIDTLIENIVAGKVQGLPKIR